MEVTSKIVKYTLIGISCPWSQIWSRNLQNTKRNSRIDTHLSATISVWRESKRSSYGSPIDVVSIGSQITLYRKSNSAQNKQDKLTPLRIPVIWHRRLVISIMPPYRVAHPSIIAFCSYDFLIHWDYAIIYRFCTIIASEFCHCLL
jgi:hypothetical protein